MTQLQPASHILSIPPLHPEAGAADEPSSESILTVYKRYFHPHYAHVLEIGGGNTQIPFLAPHFRHIHFTPASIVEACGQFPPSELANIAAPILLDPQDPETWPLTFRHSYNAILCVHPTALASPAFAGGVMHCANALLHPGGFLSLFGPRPSTEEPPRNADDPAASGSRALAMATRGSLTLPEICKIARWHEMALVGFNDLPHQHTILFFAHAG
jgi:hypothetical protein